MTIKRSEAWKTDDGLYRCPFCEKKFSKMGICSHIWRMHNIDGQKHDTTKFLPGSGNEAWNKGLTKETDNRVQLSGESISQYFQQHGGVWKNKTLSQEHKKKLSDAAQKGVKEGRWHTGNSWLGVIEYNSPIAGTVYLMGKWELAYAKYLDRNRINWKLNQKRFKYKSNHLPNKSKIGYYKPDFFLVDENRYVEVKGYETNLDHDKWSQFPHSLTVLRGKDLLELGLNIVL